MSASAWRHAIDMSRVAGTLPAASSWPPAADVLRWSLDGYLEAFEVDVAAALAEAESAACSRRDGEQEDR